MVFKTTQSVTYQVAVSTDKAETMSESVPSEDILTHLTVEDLLKLRELLSSGIHDMTPSQVESLRSMIQLYTDYNTELRTLVEEKKVNAMWAKARLQVILTAKYVLYFILAIFAAVQTVDGAASVIKKWWLS